MARTRRWDPARTADALAAQAEATGTWLGSAAAMHPDLWSSDSVLPGWTIEHLSRHLVQSIARVGEYVAEKGPEEGNEQGARKAELPRPELTAASYVRGTAALAPEVAARARRAADLANEAQRLTENSPRLGSRAAGPADRLPAALTDAGRSASEAAARHPDLVIASRLGSIRLGDFLATRCVEAVVHTRDLARSLEPLVGTGQYPPFDDDAVRTAVTVLLDALAQAAPGQAVEVRVPPFAATQCLSGPRHTRGTPSNTVETDPGTWIDLATGRLGWGEALSEHRVVVSGVRADLSDVLPVMS